MKLEAAIKHYGSRSKLAAALNLSQAMITRWNETGLVPIKHALRLNRITSSQIDLELSDYDV